MGHQIAVMRVDIEDVNQIGNLSGTRLHDRIVQLAVSNWYQNEANRYDDDRLGPLRTFQPVGPMRASYIANRLYEFSVNQIETPTLLIPVCREEDIKRTTKKVSLQATGDQIRALRRGHYGVSEDVLESLLDRAGIPVNDSSKVVKFPALRKAKAQVTEGKLVTVYYIDRAPRLGLFDSLSQARTAALELAEDSEDTTVTVKAKQVRKAEDGSYNEDLVVVERPVCDGKITVEYLEETLKANPKISYFLVAFDYHS